MCDFNGLVKKKVCSVPLMTFRVNEWKSGGEGYV